MRKLFLISFLIVFFNWCYSIEPEDIKSAQLYPQGNQVGLPIIQLNSNQKLQLKFDVLSDDAPFLSYSIQHYNSDWSKADLNPLDYAKGFHTGNIDNFEFSFNTNQLYTHYQFAFPNNQLKLKVSGNYKIIVFENSVNEPLVEKKFFVTEQAISIQGNIENAVNFSRIDSHHQIDFVINTEAFDSPNPRQDFQANVIQNFRLDNALIDITPNRVNDNVLYFNNPFDFNFEAGNEFRWFNTRSIRYKTDGVAEIISKDGQTDVWLIPALPRKKQQFIVWNDFNGQYVIDHQEGRNPDIDADYVNVHFTLKENEELKGKNIYLYGALTNWEIKEEYKLELNARQNLLETVLYLKQGNYDYQFIVEDEQGYTVGPTEGNFYRTGNDYTVFVYFAPFGARYERLVGVQVFNSIF